MATMKVMKIGFAPGLLRSLLPLKKFQVLGAVNYSSKNQNENGAQFDIRMLDVLACPLSKKPLRFDAANNELVCDELGVAYPIVRGIPNLNPQDGRMIEKGTVNDTSTTTKS